MSVEDYSTTPATNTAVGGINIAENCPPGNVNDAIRQLMADLAAFVAAARPISQGGTGGTTAAEALANLGALNKAGDTMSGDLDMAGNDVWRIGRLGTSVGTVGDYMQLETTRGLELYENGVFKAVVGQINDLVNDLTVQGGSVVHANRTIGQSGCIVFAKSTSTVTKTFGQTIPGDNLLLSDSSAIGSGILNGTWASLGRCQPGNSCSFIKVA